MAGWRIYGKAQEKSMDINITAIERSLRLYSAPGFLTLLGIVGLILIDPSGQGVSGVGVLAIPVKRFAFAAAGLIGIGGALWLGYRGWQEWRWERGELDGDCRECGGVVRHLTGRYGSYSKCMMCGAKRRGG